MFDVALGLAHDVVVAARRKARAVIFGDRRQCGRMAALDQDVGNSFAQMRTGRDRLEMQLTFLLRDVDEIIVVEHRRFPEHRARDRDVVVPRQAAGEAWRRLGYRRDPLAELRDRHALDLVDELAQHVVEHADVLFLEAVGAYEKKVRDTPQGRSTAVTRPMAEGRFDLVQK